MSPALHALVYIWDDWGGQKPALVVKIGTKHLYAVQCFPDIRVRKFSLNCRWSPAETSQLPGRAYRRLGRKNGISKAATLLLKGVE
jgi:hypothetical protein